jgi:hypothetical protein
VKIQGPEAVPGYLVVGVLLRDLLELLEARRVHQASRIS